MNKIHKTASELRATVMTAIMQDPKCDDVASVTIIPRSRHAPYHPNWEVTWGMRTVAPTPFEADMIMRLLQAEYELF
jgi:hypothetical protein